MNIPLKILHLTLASEPGGLSRYIFDLGSAMHAQGHQVFVAGDRGEIHSMFESAPFPWIEIPLKAGPIAFLKSASILRKFLRANPVDVIHTHYRRATLLARRLQQNRSPPVLYTLHLSHMSLAGPRKWLSDFGDHTHIASEDSRGWLIDEAHVKPEKITLVPHGIEVARFPEADAATRDSAKRALGLPEGARVASYVGRFDYPKNEEWLLDLACVTRGEMPHLHLLLVGGGPNEPALRHRIDSENLHDRVHLHGYQDPLPIYQATDLLLLPSVREGFSLVCAEAMSVGVPVLRTRTSGTTDLILENITGRSVPIEHDAFIDAAVSMLADRAALNRMGAAAARHIHEKFTFRQQLSQTLDLYHRIAKLNSP